MCSLAPGGSSPACLEEREVHSSDRAASTEPDIHACTNRNTHQLKDYNGADPAMKTPVSAVGVCVCVCASVVGPFGSKGPCRALGVLIRQPQPSLVHDRKKEGGAVNRVRRLI